MKTVFSFLPFFAVLWLAACAGTAGKSTEDGKDAARFESLRPGLNTAEDSLVLDLLIGYQTLLARSGSAVATDDSALQRARDAARQLEYMLRYGGVVNRGHADRVVKLPDGTRLTLREAVDQMSRALLRTGGGPDWKPAAERAREIERHKPDLAALAEDAAWVLALSSALESGLPDGVKKQLRQLHQSYARGDSHEDIARQVEDLLPEIKDDSLRLELKELANRSWDRDRRKQPPAAAAGSAPPEKAIPIIPIPQQTSDSAAPSLKDTQGRIDSLISQGRYLEALGLLGTLKDPADAKWVAGRRQNLGNHYCEDRRNAAAAAFIAGQKAARDSTRTRDLRQSLSDLDSCLSRFPDAATAAKVRRNRTLVQKELNR